MNQHSTREPILLFRDEVHDNTWALQRTERVANFVIEVKHGGTFSLNF